MKVDFPFRFIPLGDIGWVSFEINEFSWRFGGLAFPGPAECKAWFERRFRRRKRHRVRWVNEAPESLDGVIECLAR